MKALTLTQPYATLVAMGLKQYETRSWLTNHRGPLAIHAAAGFGGVGGRRAFEEICLGLPGFFRAQLDQLLGVGGAKVWMLPLGEVIAVTWLEDCVTAERADPDEDERAVGDFTPGRWAWRLRQPIVLSRPIEAHGWQRLWNLDDALIPENVRKAITHAV